MLLCARNIFPARRGVTYLSFGASTHCSFSKVLTCFSKLAIRYSAESILILMPSGVFTLGCTATGGGLGAGFAFSARRSVIVVSNLERVCCSSTISLAASSVLRVCRWAGLLIAYPVQV